MIEKLRELAGVENVFADEPMSRYSTFKAGGNAKCFVQIASKSVLSEVIKYISGQAMDYFILGNGSNILVRDSGYDGVVIKLNGDEFRELKADRDEKLLVAGAAVLLSKAAKAAAGEKLSGMETLAGIPGSVGGAVFMNAGAYGGEIKDVIKSATVMDRNGNIIELTRDELKLAYRHSVIEEKGYIVLGATFGLEYGIDEEIQDKMRECARARKEKQPLEYPSAGSTFKRPEGYFAGKLIMDAGLRGYRVGGAMVSEKHCGFVINYDNATATDILTLMEDVKNEVYRQFGVMLEPEVRILG